MATNNEPVGVNRDTGGIVSGWEFVRQEIHTAFTTTFFERVMRPYVGSNGRRLFGELANVRTAMRFRWACILALTTINDKTSLPMVPNFEPVRIDQIDLDRTGYTAWVIDGFYLPRGHLGDRTRASRRSLTMTATRGGISIQG